MENKKELIWTAITVLVLVLAGGTFWLIHDHKSKTANLAATVTSSDNSATTDSGNGGLSVSNSSAATDLGQLGTSSQNGTSSQTGVSGGSSASSSGASPVDPSTFSQYDKYKGNSTALFGDVAVGSGATAAANSTVAISYKGWLTDGTLFDESKTGANGQLQALSFTLGGNQVVPGMEEGVAGMKVGGTRLIIIPPALGYGASGQGSIPGNAVLVFEVSLLDAK